MVPMVPALDPVFLGFTVLLCWARSSARNIGWRQSGKFDHGTIEFERSHGFAQNLAIGPIPSGIACSTAVDNTGGYYGDIEHKCRIFYLCEPDGRQHIFACPELTKFNNHIQICDWQYKVDDRCNPLYFIASETNLKPLRTAYLPIPEVVPVRFWPSINSHNFHPTAPRPRFVNVSPLNGIIETNGKQRPASRPVPSFGHDKNVQTHKPSLPLRDILFDYVSPNRPGKPVHRVPGWQSNIGNRLNNVIRPILPPRSSTGFRNVNQNFPPILKNFLEDDRQGNIIAEQKPLVWLSDIDSVKKDIQNDISFSLKSTGDGGESNFPESRSLATITWQSTSAINQEALEPQRRSSLALPVDTVNEAHSAHTITSNGTLSSETRDTAVIELWIPAHGKMS